MEGFYGRPYDRVERAMLLDMVAFSPGTPAWLHAPKDDPLHRIRWRDARPDNDDCQAGIDHAHLRGVSWIQGVSPWGFTGGDGPVLRSRVREAASRGAGALAVLFDDVREPPAPDLAVRQIDLAVEGSCGSDIPFMVCPTVYCDEQVAPGDPSEYLGRFVDLLPEDWSMLWTGPAVVSRRMDLGCHVKDLADEGRLVVWDNLLADDYALRRVYLGSPAGRIPGGCGYLLNPSSLLVPALMAAWRLARSGGSEVPCPQALQPVEKGLEILAWFHSTPWEAAPRGAGVIADLAASLPSGVFPQSAADALSGLEAMRDLLPGVPGGFGIIPIVTDTMRMLGIWRRALATPDPRAELSRLLLERLPYEHPLALATLEVLTR